MYLPFPTPFDLTDDRSDFFFSFSEAAGAHPATHWVPSQSDYESSGLQTNQKKTEAAFKST